MGRIADIVGRKKDLSSGDDRFYTFHVSVRGFVVECFAHPFPGIAGNNSFHDIRDGNGNNIFRLSGRAKGEGDGAGRDGNVYRPFTRACSRRLYMPASGLEEYFYFTALVGLASVVFNYNPRAG